ncbi:MAG: hypothetical protein EPO35_12275 [Acidobacteria bacterium]|nr:MAG: hypothetical protein EPO35_12275 [Acidobacteriota bacterium]
MKAHGYVIGKAGASSPDFALSLSSGFMATIAITMVMYLLPAVGLPQVDLPLWIARLFVDGPASVGALGVVIHLATGLVFAWIYSQHVEPRLILGPATSGLLFGGAMWVFVQGLAVPVLGSIGSALGGTGAGPGLFSAGLGAAAAAASLVAHLAYGGVLGYVYGCRGGGRCRKA